MRLPKEFTICSTLLEPIYRAERIATLQSLPAVIARSAATRQSRCSNGDGFSDEIAALRSQ